jgi:hypothetical protein
VNDVAKPIKGGFGGAKLGTFHEHDALPWRTRAEAIHYFGEVWRARRAPWIDPPTQRP